MSEMVSIFIFAYWVSKIIIAFFKKDGKGFGKLLSKTKGQIIIFSSIINTNTLFVP